MRQDIFLFVFTLVLAFASGNITYQIKSNQNVKIEDIKEINEINNDLRKENLPYIRLDLNIDYPTPEHLRLLIENPNLKSRKSITRLNSTDCLQNRIEQLRSEFLDKESIWLGYKCNQIDKLPKNFFTTAPFLNSDNESYAYLFYRILKNSPEKQIWYNQYAKYMHLNELKKISWPLDQEYQFLYSVEASTIRKIIEGNKVILDDNYYLIKNGNLKYFVLESKQAKKHFKRAGYTLSTQKSGCFIKAEDVCWNKKPHNLLSFLSQGSIVFFIVTIIILLMSAWALFSRVRKQKKEEERKRHALRVLTHELRTPVASLLLQVDNFTHDHHDISARALEDIASIESNIYRLKHLAEKSTSYLETEVDSIINIKNERFDLRKLCEDILKEYPGVDISLQADVTCELSSDIYWTQICITNLIDNAIRYGKAPIKLTIDQDKKYHTVTVTDNGEINFNDIKSLMNASHTKSVGLGLGVKIISTTMKALGGELSLKSSPTRFILKFKDKKDE